VTDVRMLSRKPAAKKPAASTAKEEEASDGS
jgi:hypothetical protein